MNACRFIVTLNQKITAVSLLFQMYHLRKLSQGSVEHPKAPLGNNSRPTQDLRERTVRTNINFAQRTESDPQVKI